MNKRIVGVLFAGIISFAMILGGCERSESIAEEGPVGGSETKSSFLPLENLVSCDQNFSQTGTEDGAYIRRTLLDWSEVLTFIDYEAKIGVPLCSQANCTHSDDTCTAWLPVGWVRTE